MKLNQKLRLVYSESSHDADPVIGDLLNTWATWMDAAGLSNKTIQGRVETISLFARRTGTDPVTASWVPIAEFLAPYTAGTQQYYRANLRAWFHWLVLLNYRADDPTLKLHRGKPVRRKPRPLSRDQLDALLSARVHPRTMPMLLLGAYEGLRVMEIAKFRGDDIEDGQLRVVGKGGIEDHVPLHPLVARAADGMPPDFWFPSYWNDGPILANSCSSIISQVMRRAGIKAPLTPHSLRHTFGTELLKSTGNLALVQRLMRHTNIASTVVYTDVDQDQRRAAVHSLPVPANLQLAA